MTELANVKGILDISKAAVHIIAGLSEVLHHPENRRRRGPISFRSVFRKA
jgi:hypothetical protein